MTSDVHVLVDINNIIHKAYFSIRTKYEHSVNPGDVTVKVIGLLNSYLKDLGKYEVLSVFFDGNSLRRKSISEEYKNHRKDYSILDSSVNVTLRDGTYIDKELDLLKHLLQRLGSSCYYAPDEEADDLISSYCKYNDSGISIIISDDKDFFQLVNNRVYLYRPNDRKIYDVESSTNFWEKYNKGNHPKVKPSQVRMFKTLCGDSSDNIKGIYKLNKKKAVQYCDHNSIDDLLADTTIEPKMLESFLLFQSLLRKNWILTGMNDSLDVNNYKSSLKKDIEHVRITLAKLYKAHIPLLNYCKVDKINSLLPDWYNEL